MLEGAGQCEEEVELSPQHHTDAHLARLARVMLAERQRIELHFSPDLFGDPARDMLLDLFAAAVECRDISISSLTIAARVPSTTALRHINRLYAAGLLTISGDLQDGRRKNVQLAPAAVVAMRRYLGWVSDVRSVT